MLNLPLFDIQEVILQSLLRHRYLPHLDHNAICTGALAYTDDQYVSGDDVIEVDFNFLSRRRRVTVFGRSAKSEDTAERALCLARFSTVLPSKTSVMTTADASK